MEEIDKAIEAAVNRSIKTGRVANVDFAGDALDLTLRTYSLDFIKDCDITEDWKKVKGKTKRGRKFSLQIRRRRANIV